MRNVATTAHALARALVAADLFILPCMTAAAEARPLWPSLDAQLRQSHIEPGSELERFVRDNQDFSILRPAEARDTLGLPPWLRVAWRKSHPELDYKATDPTGGYPRVLQNVVQWMIRHQDLPESSTKAAAAAASESLAQVGTNLRISGSSSAPRSESSIAINIANASKIISASNDIGIGRQAQFFSSDGGATWGLTSLPNVTGDSSQSDPSVDWTSDGTAWAATVGISRFGTVLKLRWFKSTDSGATWASDSTVSGTQSVTDKPMTWVDRGPSSPFKDYAYAIWHNGGPVYMNRKNGVAGAWNSSPTRVSNVETTGSGIGGGVTTNASGDVFGLWPDTGSSKLYMVKSTDGGTTFSSPSLVAATFDTYNIGIPAMDSRRALIYVAAGAYRTGTKNNVYAAWIDQTGASGCNSPADEPGSNVSSPCTTRIWFTRSTNGGTGWSSPVMINNPPTLNDQFNPWLAVDDTNGRISILYYDTVNDPGRLKTDVYYQSSADDGATWSLPIRVTTAMTDETVAGADLGNQYGDYNGMSAYNDTVFPSWTDRRSGGAEEIWTAKIMETNAPPPPGVSDGLTVNKDASVNLVLAWNADCGGSTTYGIYRGNLLSGYSSIAPEPGFCSVSGTTVTIPQGSNTADFLLVVPNNGSNEGSYGHDSTGARRPPATVECFPQGTLAACAP